MQWVGELLVKTNIPRNQLQEFFDLLNICWCPNYCKFGEKFFEFPTFRVPHLWNLHVLSLNLISFPRTRCYWVIFTIRTGTWMIFCELGLVLSFWGISIHTSSISEEWYSLRNSKHPPSWLSPNLRAEPSFKVGMRRTIMIRVRLPSAL